MLLPAESGKKTALPGHILPHATTNFNQSNITSITNKISTYKRDLRCRLTDHQNLVLFCAHQNNCTRTEFRVMLIPYRAGGRNQPAQPSFVVNCRNVRFILSKVAAIQPDSVGLQHYRWSWTNWTQLFKSKVQGINSSICCFFSGNRYQDLKRNALYPFARLKMQIILCTMTESE